MKFVLGLIIGVIAGIAIANRMMGKDPDVVTLPDSGGTSRKFTDQASKIASKVSSKASDTVQAARTNIQNRRGDNGQDWN